MLQECQSYLDDSPVTHFDELRQILAEHYSLGELVYAKKINKGYVNTNYEISMFHNGCLHRYLLRVYRKGVRGKKIKFEHALLKHLMEQNFGFSPCLFKTRTGKTFVKLKKPSQNGKNLKYYLTVFNFLQGEDKYSWNHPLCTEQELADAARVLALYHNNVFGWESEKTWAKPVFIDYMPLMVQKWSEYIRMKRNSGFELYFRQHFSSLLRMVQSLQIGALRTYRRIPQIAIHGDYHPGNLKFQKEKVVAVFDFDWAKVDIRCFDVSLALNYFCSSWNQPHDGQLLLNRVEIFLQAYQQTFKNLKSCYALNDRELHCLPEVMMMSNLSVIDWAVKDFYRKQPDSEEYQHYLQHNVHLMHDLAHKQDLLAASIPKWCR